MFCGVSGLRVEKWQGDFLWLRRGWEGLACWWTSPRDVGCSLAQGSLLPSPFTKREQKCSDKIKQIKYLGLYFRAKCFNSIFINGFRKSCLCPFPSASLFCYSCSHENPSDTTPPSSLGNVKEFLYKWGLWVICLHLGSPFWYCFEQWTDRGRKLTHGFLSESSIQTLWAEAPGNSTHVDMNSLCNMTWQSWWSLRGTWPGVILM